MSLLDLACISLFYCNCSSKEYTWVVIPNGDLTFSLVNHRGLWYGGVNVKSSFWGYNQVASLSNKGFVSLDECISFMWADLIRTVSLHDNIDWTPISYKTKWFEAAVVEYEKFISGTDRFKFFKETV